MIKINVILNNIIWKKYLRNPRNFIDKNLKLINKKNNQLRNKKLICTLLLSDSYEIKKLNKKFRGKNKSTDILSFPFHEKDKLRKKIKLEKEIYLGDIVINFNKIKNKSNKIKFIEEFNRLWIHGLVHLFGHKHKRNKDFYKMRKIEVKYLRYIN